MERENRGGEKKAEVMGGRDRGRREGELEL